MNFKSKLYYFSLMFLISIIVLITPFTNGKFIISNYGIAWDNHFTEFSQLKEVFYIEDSAGEEAEELWGGISLGNTSIGKISQNGDYYSFGSSNSTPVKTIDEVKAVYGDYFIEKLKNIELNCVNLTSQRMVICFQIYYYAPRYQDVSTHISFGVYNTILNETNNKDNVLRGEFIVDQGSSDYTHGQYSGLIENPTQRTSGNANGQFLTQNWGGDYYYPHYAIINPYEIIYDSGNPIDTGHHDLEVVDPWWGDPYVDGDNGSVCYKYPAVDENSSPEAGSGEAQCEADNLMNKLSLEDFILNSSESGSFNLSLYFGNYESVNKQNGSCCFVTSLDLIAKPEIDIIQNIYDSNNNAVLPSYYEVVDGKVQVKVN